MQLKKIYYWIINQGVDESDISLKSRQIRSTNFIVLLTFVFFSPLLIFNFSNDIASDRIFGAVYLLINLVFIYFNSLKWYNLSRLSLVILTDLIILVLADFQDRASGIAINFFIVFAVIFLIFSYAEKWKMLFCVLFTIFCFVLLEAFDYEITGINRHKNLEDLKIDYIYNAIGITVATCVGLFYYSWQYYRTEESLRDSLVKAKLSEEITNAVIETNNNLIWIVDKEYRLVKYNNLFQFSYKAGFGVDIYIGYKMIGDKTGVPPQYFPSWKKNQEKWKANYDRCFKGNNFTENDEIEILDNSVYLENSLYHIKISDDTSYVAVFSKDVTSKVLFDKKLNQNLVEKELLLKEIHHRVKNNMQVIIGLIQLQELYTDDQKINKIFIEVNNRIKAMSLVHELLYQSEDLSYIDFNRYIERLVSHIYSSYKDVGITVEFEFSSQPHFLTIESAIPLGLLVNELLTNSLKYAFAEKQFGRIELGIKEQNNAYIFYFYDNGVGIPKNISFENASTLGLNLVSRLVDQVNGKLELIIDNGTKFNIYLENKA